MYFLFFILTTVFLAFPFIILICAFLINGLIIILLSFIAQFSNSKQLNPPLLAMAILTISGNSHSSPSTSMSKTLFLIVKVLFSTLPIFDK